MKTYLELLTEKADETEDIYHHGIARDTNNPNAIVPVIDILEECFGLVKPDFLDKYIGDKDDV